METPSYRHLADVYDQLFPLDPEALALIKNALSPFEPPQRIIDAGCGTGLLARTLADLGHRVHGFDLDPDLLAVASGRGGDGVTFALGDLRTFTVPVDVEASALLLCFGNTLPHLTEPADLDWFFRRAVATLAPRGQILIQVLDYDWLEGEGRLTLPERQVGPWHFKRRYEVKPSGLWAFHTLLEGPQGRRTGTFDLRPWRKQELVAAMARVGLQLEGDWGGFDRRPSGNSLPLVLSGRLH